MVQCTVCRGNERCYGSPLALTALSLFRCLSFFTDEHTFASIPIHFTRSPEPPHCGIVPYGTTAQNILTELMFVASAIPCPRLSVSGYVHNSVCYTFILLTGYMHLGGPNPMVPGTLPNPRSAVQPVQVNPVQYTVLCTVL